MQDAEVVAYGQKLLAEYAAAGTAGAAPLLYAAAGYALVSAVPIIAAALSWIGISYLFGDGMMLGFAGAERMQDDTPEHRQVRRTVENVALTAGLPAPAVYIIDDNSLNAFATGRAPGSSSIALTSGIIAKLSKEELEGVIAHEMAHIKNRDMRLNMLIITGFCALAFFAEILMRAIRSCGRSNRGSNNKNSGGVVMILLGLWLLLAIFNLVVGPIINMALSRSQEYTADATGALFTRNPKALASALGKIKPDPVVETLCDNRTMSVACIAYPHAGKSFFELASTHPPIDERIARLMRM
jgi:heat shock protein HtpX